jgi:hypothetical protein
MRTELDASFRALYKAYSRRYGVLDLTAMMTMQALEAIFPLAPEHAKIAAVRALQVSGRAVTVDQFIDLMNNVKSLAGYQDDDVIRSTSREALRLDSLPQSNISLIPTDLRRPQEDELERRAFRISQLESELAHARRQYQAVDIPLPPKQDRDWEAQAIAAVAANRYHRQMHVSDAITSLRSDLDSLSPLHAIVTTTDVANVLQRRGPPAVPHTSRFESPSQTPKSHSRFAAGRRLLQLERGATQDAFLNRRELYLSP